MDNHSAEKQRLTEALIKDGFLQALKSRKYSEITVSEICRIADISRGTFYRRFENISSVYESIIADMADITATMHDKVRGGGADCKIPLCQFIRENEKYRPILMDQTLSEMYIEYSSAHKEDPVVDERKDLTEEQQRTLKAFLLSGCLYVIRQNLRSTDRSWNELQCAIDQFILRGSR